MRMFQVCVCGQPLQLNEQPTPEPKGTEVLLKVLAAGVCHSDLHLADGWFDLGGGKRMSLADRGMKLPVTLGHENVGEVVAFGPDVKGVKVGDRRLAHPWIGCGTCGPCQRGEENLCRAMRSLGVFSNGGYADYLMVPHPRYLFDIGDLPPDRAAPLACSGVTTYGALKKISTLKSEPTVIIGAGGLGLMCLALHKAMGGHSAIVVDIDPVKRDAAKKAGAAKVVDGGAADASQQIIDMTNGGAWGVIDLVGSSQSARVGYDCLIKGGKYVDRRALWRRSDGLIAADPHAGADDPGLLCRQPAGDEGVDRACSADRNPAGPCCNASSRGRECGDGSAPCRQGDRPRGADAELRKAPWMRTGSARCRRRSRSVTRTTRKRHT